MKIKDIQDLPLTERLRLCRLLIPVDCYRQFHIDPVTFRDRDKLLRLRLSYRNEGKILIMRVVSPDTRDDPIYSIVLQDYEEDGVDCLGLNINNPAAPRFIVDMDDYGHIPADRFSTRRNIPEEIRSMEAGLSPGQVRKGLRWLNEVIECLENFTKYIGREFIYCEAMAYHNAMVYERHGFGYQFNSWLEEMQSIDQEFCAPNGMCYKRLDGSSPFRRPGMEKSVRGRSWAIHDGILGRPWSKPAMIKEVGVHAGVNTFRNGQY